MAKLRAAAAYRRIKRAYTRKSRVRAKSFIKGAPHPRVVMYDMGNKVATFPYEIHLIARKAQQVRENAIEAARAAVVRHMEKSAGKENFKLKIRVVPHHVLRENPLATGAGADRFQTGMSLAFGKAIGHAAQVKEGKVLLSIYTDKQFIDAAREAARKAKSKLGLPCSIEVQKI